MKQPPKKQQLKTPPLLKLLRLKLLSSKKPLLLTPLQPTLLLRLQTLPLLKLLRLLTLLLRLLNNRLPALR